MATDELEDRRRAERVPVNAEFADLAAGAIGAGIEYVSDLSEQGVFLHTAMVIPVGTRLRVRFTILLDDPVVIEGSGTVARHSAEPQGLGISFQGLSPEMILRISDAVTRQRPRDSGAPVVPMPALDGVFHTEELPITLDEGTPGEGPSS